jgi:hypothetical protein
MLVIVPSRNRPHSVYDLLRCWEQTGATAQLLVAVNSDDPAVDAYMNLLKDAPPHVRWLRCPTSTMISALNYAAMQLSGKHDIVGFMGDDHRPRTYGWDERIREQFAAYGPSVVYANDQLQGVALPTQVFLPGEFVRRVGAFAPATLTHLYADNYWKAVGEGVGALRYLPDVIIEHVHPVAGKVSWDEDYLRANSTYDSDRIAFEEYEAAGTLRRDIEILDTLQTEWSHE